MPFSNKVKRCCLCSTDKKQKYTTLCVECKRIQQYIRDNGILKILNFINTETKAVGVTGMPSAPPQYR